MRIVKVYIEHPVMKLNTTFTYLVSGQDFLARGMRVKVDFNGQKIVGFVDEVNQIDNVDEYEKTIGYSLKEIDEIIDEQPLINEELYNLGLWLSKQTVSPVISCFQAMLPAALKPATTKQSIATIKWVVIKDEMVKKEYGFDNDEMALSAFKEKVNDYRYKKLKDNNRIEVIDKIREAKVDDLDIKDSPFTLNDIQSKAIDRINNSNKDVILLHGLTGSGKTEVYMNLVKEVVLSGKQALILVPEISLTPMMLERFRKRFGNNIAAYHSGLSGQQKYEQYCLVKDNKVKIVIGTRSAVFMPFKQLGIIILDEEHDNSYKQDSSPRYNTKDVAIYRASKHNCKVILGSATPTLESYARAIKNVYELVNLDKRVNNSLPQSYLIDMAYESRQGNFIISKPLKDALKQRLDENKQAILLLNRRGYTPVMKCGVCGHTMTCPHCDITLSYHKDEDMLVCHSCGYTQSADIDCPECGKRKWRNYGLGTQRLVEELQNQFPQARIARMDADVTKVKDAHRKILDGFGNGEYDFLVGTQMISKGLDYPNVTLVGIFNADGPLNRSDYRSVETTFDLIVQASGRSGRSKDLGEVYIQVYDTSHYAIRLAMQQNYVAFFNNEMQYRHLGKYPPYSYMIAVVFASKDEKKADEEAYQMAKSFREDETIKVLGPSKLIKKKDEYRFRVILKSTNKESLIDKLWDWYDKEEINKHQLSIAIDVDPYILD